jgi:hypothetical protein
MDALFCTRRQSKTPCLGKTTLRVRDYVQTVGLNAETKKDRHRAPGEPFVLTFPFIGLFRLWRLPCTTEIIEENRGFEIFTSGDRLASSETQELERTSASWAVPNWRSHFKPQDSWTKSA